jgi:hypothetical protein
MRGALQRRLGRRRQPIPARARRSRLLARRAGSGGSCTVSRATNELDVGVAFPEDLEVDGEDERCTARGARSRDEVRDECTVPHDVELEPEGLRDSCCDVLYAADAHRAQGEWDLSRRPLSSRQLDATRWRAPRGALWGAGAPRSALQLALPRLHRWRTSSPQNRKAPAPLALHVALRADLPRRCAGRCRTGFSGGSRAQKNHAGFAPVSTVSSFPIPHSPRRASVPALAPLPAATKRATASAQQQVPAAAASAAEDSATLSPDANLEVFDAARLGEASTTESTQCLHRAAPFPGTDSPQEPRKL